MRTPQSSLEPIRSAYGFVNRRSTVQSRPPAQESHEKTEEWRPIVGFPHHRVSSLGRVMKYRSERILKGSDEQGYRKVGLTGADGKSVRLSVHRLVAAAFIGPCPAGMEVDHVDGVRWHNATGNLEYVTHLENIRRAHARSRAVAA